MKSGLAGGLGSRGHRQGPSALAGTGEARDPGRYPQHVPPRSKGLPEGKTDAETFSSFSVWTNSDQGHKWLEKIQAPVEKSSIAFRIETQRPCSLLLCGGQGCKEVRSGLWAICLRPRVLSTCKQVPVVRCSRAGQVTLCS